MFDALSAGRRGWRGEDFGGSMMKKPMFIAVVAVAQGCATVAMADDAKGTVQAPVMPEIVVTATRTPEPLQDVPASVSFVTGEQIQDTPAQGLDDILQFVPGMTLNEIGPDVGHPTAYNEGMRGLPPTATRMLVMVDGVPVNDAFFSYIQWNLIPLDNIDHVEIVRGGGSPLWGNMAMGGVVNVITHTPGKEEFTGDAAGGSYGSYRTSAYGAYQVTNGLTLSLNAAANGTDGYQTTPASWYTYGATTLRSPVYTPTSLDAQSVGVRGDFAPMNDLTGFVVVNYHDVDQVLSTPIGGNDQQTMNYAGQIKKSFPNEGSITATIFHNDTDFDTNNPHILTFTTEYNSNVHTTLADDTGGSLAWSQNLTGILRNYTIGADMHYVSGSDTADYYLPNGQLGAPPIIGSGKQLFAAGFAQASLVPIQHLDIVGSLRYQFYENFDGVDTFPPAVGTIPTSDSYHLDPRVNVRYAINDEFAARAAYYQSFRAPTLDELYRTYADTTAGIYEGNPFLRPETLEGEEIGLDFTRPGIRSQLTLYTSNINNLITSENLPQGPLGILGIFCGYDYKTYTYLTCTRNVNAAAAVARGIEEEVTWDIGKGFSTRLAYTYADSRYTSDPINPAAVGERLEGVPRHNASGSITYVAPTGWRVSADLRYVSTSWGDATGVVDNLVQGSHFVVDTSAAYPITDHIQAYVQIQNLLDRQYIANNFGGAPILGTPFEVMSGLRVSWK